MPRPPTKTILLGILALGVLVALLSFGLVRGCAPGGTLDTTSEVPTFEPDRQILPSNSVPIAVPSDSTGAVRIERVRHPRPDEVVATIALDASGAEGLTRLGVEVPRATLFPTFRRFRPVRVFDLGSDDGSARLVVTRQPVPLLDVDLQRAGGGGALLLDGTPAVIVTYTPIRIWGIELGGAGGPVFDGDGSVVGGFAAGPYFQTEVLEHLAVGAGYDVARPAAETTSRLFVGITYTH